MIRKISGKSKSASYKHLNTNFNNTGAKATSKKDIADTLGSTFMKNSSNRNYCEKFQTYMYDQQKFNLNFKSSNTEEYNNPFNLVELKEAINKSHDTATGPDEVHYQMLKHLPPKSLQALLDIFNDIWETGKFPESWELSTIIPFPKPGKDHTEPTNYRPIALTSCLCKTLERMINTRLIWYLESNNLISPVQSGFRSERGTNDNLIRLETLIRDAFIKKEHVVAVFFDLEKAYDTTWRYGILRDLHELGLKVDCQFLLKVSLRIAVCRYELDQHYLTNLNRHRVYLYGSLIPVVDEAKFLGVIFDRKLSFIPHIKYLKAKCLKALNLLKVLSHTSWGANSSILLHLYRSLIRSKLDYGAIVYGSARKSYLAMLDTVHHQGLRLALGAFRTSPVESLYVEADEPSLYLRREKLTLQYAIRLAANPSNPAYKIT